MLFKAESFQFFLFSFLVGFLFKKDSGQGRFEICVFSGWSAELGILSPQDRHESLMVVVQCSTQSSKRCVLLRTDQVSVCRILCTFFYTVMNIKVAPDMVSLRVYVFVATSCTNGDAHGLLKRFPLNHMT